ncbi:unnamed protein product [Caenorhabditis auriculariae]|uniref:Uncharacterized protein n=1 Tax=Caenorhabditis auriculariae TaxID=2777116 RepID=A0A8S1H6B7_9PELO|nr:unnamed protein product [Caenorhabditis auriculariae]
MEMLSALRDTINTVSTELSTGVEKLRMNVASNVLAQQTVASDTINEIVNTKAGSDLLLRFQTKLEEIKANGEESARLANLCSTRMGRSQQMCKERSDAVMTIDEFVRNPADFEKKIREINNQLTKLTRFCNQTEQAMTHLEALSEIVRAEEEVDLIRQQSRTAATIVQIESPNVLSGEIRSRPGDEARAHQEELMLEEFLSAEKLEVP